MKFGPCMNFSPEFKFWAFYNFEPTEMSLTRLTNSLSGRGPKAKPMDRPSMVHNNYGPDQPKIQSCGAFFGLDQIGPDNPNVHM